MCVFSAPVRKILNEGAAWRRGSASSCISVLWIQRHSWHRSAWALGTPETAGEMVESGLKMLGKCWKIVGNARKMVENARKIVKNTKKIRTPIS